MWVADRLFYEEPLKLLKIITIFQIEFSFEIQLYGGACRTSTLSPASPCLCLAFLLARYCTKNCNLKEEQLARDQPWILCNTCFSQKYKTLYYKHYMINIFLIFRAMEQEQKLNGEKTKNQGVEKYKMQNISQSISILIGAYINLCANIVFVWMKTQTYRKKQSFKSPLANKIPCPSLDTQPVSHARSANKNGKIEMLSCEYDQAFMLHGSKYCYHEKVIADFMPKQSDRVAQFVDSPTEINKIKDKRFYKIHAVYNKDKRYYTPAFVMGVELINYAKVDSPVAQDLAKFREKEKQVENRADNCLGEILQPKPNSRKCQICKCQFEDYIEHIQLEKHQQLIKSSIGWRYSNDLIEEFKQRKEKQNKQQKLSKEIKNNKPRNRRQQIEKLITQVSSNYDKFKTKTIQKQVKKTEKIKKRTKNCGISATYATQS